jgi:hypothetical protein
LVVFQCLTGSCGKKLPTISDGLDSKSAHAFSIG